MRIRLTTWRNKQRRRTITGLLVLIYAVGLTGMLLPATAQLFRQLTAPALIVSFVILALFHEQGWPAKSLIALGLVCLSGFTVEAIGVQTGWIFGHYRYGQSLGVQLWETPLIIGFNWLFMVYCTAAVVHPFRLPGYAKVMLASGGMLLYDVVLEQVAPPLDMWSWEHGQIPLQNYLAWYVLALIFHGGWQLAGIHIKNQMAVRVLGCQFVFFSLLYILLNR